jgi:hypothetical protein
LIADVSGQASGTTFQGQGIYEITQIKYILTGAQKEMGSIKIGFK